MTGERRGPRGPARGIIAAVFTPFDAAGDLALDRVTRIALQTIAEGAEAIFAGGTTGEAESLTVAERKAVAESYLKAAHEKVPVIVQVGRNCLREAQDLAAHAQKIGAAAIAAAPPSYFKPGSAVLLVECMREIGSAAPELPFYYYHIPGLTGVSIPMAEFLALAAERFPALAGIKYSGFDILDMKACIDFDRGRFDFLFGSDELLLTGLLSGACGAIGSTYNFAAPLYRRIWANFDAGRLDEARRLQDHAVRMISILQRAGGQPAFKAVMQFIGLDCGPSRLPQETLSPAARDGLRRELESIGFFDWARPPRAG